MVNQEQYVLYLDSQADVEARINDLITRMTLAEKVSQMMDDSAGIDRLGIQPYRWWNEALHGVARAGLATVFPQAIGIAAAWNQDLVHQIASAISDEGRAKHHQALRQGSHEIYQGLTFWSPNINIFRDPRWGRGQETYGEDPYLTAQVGVQFVRGLQGEDDHYLKTAACAKHFAVHSGPEADRHHFDAKAGLRDMQMTYLPAFQALVKEGHVAGVMGAYNRTNGEACCASPTLLQEILREDWGFEGYVVSDCGAIRDIYQHHQLVPTPEAASALAVKSGCDLNCGCTYESLFAAVGEGLLSEDDIDRSLAYLFRIRFRLGMFDPPEAVPFAQIPVDAVCSPSNQALALEAARQSLVLLKNEDGFLPLKKDLKSVAVIGPNADDELVLRGNYYGTPSEALTVLAGIRRLVSPETAVHYARGCEIVKEGRDAFTEAVKVASRADVAIVVMGLSQQMEGEEGQEEGNPPGVLSRGDRTNIDLPGEQQALLQAVAQTGTPVVLVLLNGSALAVNWADEHLPAILEAWYPGQAGGRAVAEALFGDFNPGGRLPITFYRSVDQLPPFESYDMTERTYRYFTGDPLYRFGYGLSYTDFVYEKAAVDDDHLTSPKPVTLSCVVRNVGDCTGDEVVQVYLRDEEASLPVPRHSLVGFRRVRLAPGASRTLDFTIQPKQFAYADEEGRWVLEPGQFTLFVGGGQPGTEGVLPVQVNFAGEMVVL